jgi:hypothetical protein
MSQNGLQWASELSTPAARAVTGILTSAEALWSPQHPRRALGNQRVVTKWRIVMNVDVVGRARFAAGLGSCAISPSCLAKESENVY